MIGTIIPDSREEYEEIVALIKSDVDLSDWKDKLWNNISPNPRVLHFFDYMP